MAKGWAFGDCHSMPLAEKIKLERDFGWPECKMGSHTGTSNANWKKGEIINTEHRIMNVEGRRKSRREEVPSTNVNISRWGACSYGIKGERIKIISHAIELYGAW